VLGGWPGIRIGTHTPIPVGYPGGLIGFIIAWFSQIKKKKKIQKIASDLYIYLYNILGFFLF